MNNNEVLLFSHYNRLTVIVTYNPILFGLQVLLKLVSSNNAQLACFWSILRMIFKNVIIVRDNIEFTFWSISEPRLSKMSYFTTSQTFFYSP